MVSLITDHIRVVADRILHCKKTGMPDNTIALKVSLVFLYCRF